MKLNRKALRKLIEEQTKKIFGSLEEGTEVAPAKPATKPTTPPAPAKPKQDPFEQNPKIHEKPLPKDGGTETAPVKPATKPVTPPAPAKPKQDPFEQNPKIHEKPLPKAIAKEGIRFNEAVEAMVKTEKMLSERNRMKQLMNEAPPMDINDTPMGEPDPSIKTGIENNTETPFSGIDILKRTNLDMSTLEKLGSEEYNEIVTDVLEAGKMGMMEIQNAFMVIMGIEMNHKEALEALALETVKQAFGLPDSVTSKIDAQLLNPQNGSIDPPGGGDDEDGEEGDDENENPVDQLLNAFTDEEQQIIKQHVDKRIISNALMMGAGFKSHNVLRAIKDRLDGIDRRLYPLYMKMMPNVELFMWKMPIDFPLAGRQILGKSELVMKDEQEQEQGEEQQQQPEEEQNEDGVREVAGARAQSFLFIILLHEVAKAAVEYIFAYGLSSNNPRIDKEVIKRADSYADEHWMKLIGPRLWKYLHDLIDYIVQERDRDYTIVSRLLYKLGTLQPTEFLQLMDKVLHDGPAAIEQLKSMLDNIEADVEEYEQQHGQEPENAEIIPGQDHTREIGAAVRDNVEDLLAGLNNDEPEAEAGVKALEDMNVDELNIELEKALEDENYERAAQIRDLLT